MKSHLIGIVSAVIWVAVNNSAHANLITNGDFESGNTGFLSDYAFTVYPGSGEGGLPGAGEYAMTTNPAVDFPHAVTQSYGDHTTGSGQMMMVNGATTADLVVWSQAVAVEQNTLYSFSTWASIWATGDGGLLDFIINGTSVGTFDSYSGTTWKEFSRQINSGTSTSFNIEIIDRRLTSAGNDFSLDDISLRAVPIPSSIWLLATGLLGLIGITRTNKSK
jgi:hypothetical protein